MSLLQNKGLINKSFKLKLKGNSLGIPGEEQPTIPINSFEAQLQNTLVLQRGVGDPTFSRATTATVTDWEGIVRTALSGEIRYEGARRVRNLITLSSEVLSVANGYDDQIGGTGSNPDRTDAYAPNPIDGAMTATRITFHRGAGTTSGDYSGFSKGLAATATNLGESLWMRSNDSNTYSIEQDFGGAPITFSVTPQWRRFYNPNYLSSGSAFALRVRGNIGAFQNPDVVIYGIQAEDVIGQSVKSAPSEYVSVGVLSAPFHGANVDGVKCFTTLNGNTVTSNVVTEATGAPITNANSSYADAKGPFGGFGEGQRTNLALQSQTFDNAAWVEQIVSQSVTPNTIVAPDETTSADKLVTGTAAGNQEWQQAFTWTAAQHTFSAYLKTGGTTYGYLYAYDGVALDVGAWFNLSNGTIGTTSAGATSKIESVGSGWYRCSITFTSAVGPQYFAVGASNADNTRSWTGDGVIGIHAWGAQLEAAAFASSYIPTTTTAVTRNADVDQYVSAGNLPTNDFTLYGESEFPVVPTAADYYLFGTYVDANNSTAVLWDGTNLIARRRISNTNHDATIALTPTAGSIYKWAARFASTGTSIFLNGTKGTDDATGTACQIGTNFQVGANGNGAGQPFATVRNVKIWQQPLTTIQSIILTR